MVGGRSLGFKCHTFERCQAVYTTWGAGRRVFLGAAHSPLKMGKNHLKDQQERLSKVSPTVGCVPSLTNWAIKEGLRIWGRTQAAKGKNERM